MTVFRTLPSGARRRLPDGSVRALGASGPRFADVVGDTGVGVGAAGQSGFWQRLDGQAHIVFELSASLDSSGLLASTALRLALAGDLGGVVNLGGAAALGFGAGARLTAYRPLAGIGDVAVQIVAGISQFVRLAGSAPVRATAAGTAVTRANLRSIVKARAWVSGTLDVPASRRWIDYWRNALRARQALLDAIDAHNRHLAKSAGSTAEAAAAAVVLTNVRVTQVEGNVAAESSRTTALTSRVAAAETVNATQGSALSALQTTSTQQGSLLTSHSSQLIGITATISTLDGQVVSIANATELLDVKVNSLGVARAIKGLYLNVNGLIAGYETINNGVVAEFNIMANVFRVLSPGATNGLEVQNGYIRTWRSSAQAIMGSGIGSDSLALYAGPNVGAAGANKSNANFWVDSYGNVGMTGLLSFSALSGSALTLDSTRILTGGGRLAPFTITDGRYYVSPGTNASRTLTLDDFVSPDYGTGYHHKRFARHKMDVWIDCQISGDTGNETAIIEVSYDGGSWTQLASITFNCNYRGSFPFAIRYTTQSSWNTMAIQLRTTQNRTEAMRIMVNVANFNESGNAAGSTSGTTGGGGSPPSGGGGGGGSWCVDAATALLPDGTPIRSLRAGDLVPCWNEDAETPAIEYVPVRAIELATEACFELVTGSGARLIQSRSTPMTLRNGTTAYTADMRGQDVLVLNSSGMFWEPVLEVVPMGERTVVRLSLGGRTFFAGAAAEATIATHNIQKIDPIEP